MALSAKCPPGALCLDTTTVISVLVILALAGYIIYLHASKTRSKTDVTQTQEVIAEEEEDVVVQKPTYPAPTSKSFQKQTQKQRYSTSPKSDVFQTSAFATPQVTTNIYQTSTYDDPMLRPPLRSYV